MLKNNSCLVHDNEQYGIVFQSAEMWLKSGWMFTER